MNSTVFGLALIFAGVGLIALIFLILRTLLRTPPQAEQAAASALAPGTEAVLLVKPGGRVAYASQAARELFEIAGQEPNLERMARQARPQEAFLGLCAAEGKASFSLRGHPVDGVAYIVPFEDASAMLVALRRPQLLAVSTEDGSRSLDRFLHLNQEINLSLDLETTLNSLLEHVAGLVPADYLEVTVWQPEENCLVPYRLTSAAGADRRLDKTSERYPLDRGYSSILFNERRALLILPSCSLAGTAGTDRSLRCCPAGPAWGGPRTLRSVPMTTTAASRVSTQPQVLRQRRVEIIRNRPRAFVESEHTRRSSRVSRLRVASFPQLVPHETFEIRKLRKTKLVDRRFNFQQSAHSDSMVSGATFDNNGYAMFSIAA